MIFEQTKQHVRLRFTIYYSEPIAANILHRFMQDLKLIGGHDRQGVLQVRSHTVLPQSVIVDHDTVRHGQATLRRARHHSSPGRKLNGDPVPSFDVNYEVVQAGGPRGPRAHVERHVPVLVVHPAHQVEHFVAHLEDALPELHVPVRADEILVHHVEHLPLGHVDVVVILEAVGAGPLHAAGPHAPPNRALHLLEVARVQMVEHFRTGAGEVAPVVLVCAGEVGHLEYHLHGEVSRPAEHLLAQGTIGQTLRAVVAKLVARRALQQRRLHVVRANQTLEDAEQVCLVALCHSIAAVVLVAIR